MNRTEKAEGMNNAGEIALHPALGNLAFSALFISNAGTEQY